MCMNMCNLIHVFVSLGIFPQKIDAELCDILKQCPVCDDICKMILALNS